MQHGALSILALLLLLGCSKGLPAAEPPASNRADAAIEVPASSPAGFQFPYLLVPPLDAHRASPPFLLVETNNTGIVSDNFEVHRQAAHVIASVSSVGHYVAARLNVPFLVPIFPRPASPTALEQRRDRSAVPDWRWRSQQARRSNVVGRDVAARAAVRLHGCGRRQ
jgi:hypothetical protein